MKATDHALRNIFNYQGRSTRSQYWYYTLQATLIWVAWILLSLILLGKESPIKLVIDIGLYLVMALAGISIGVRRLHDADLRGWWLLVPFLSFVLLCFASTPVDNRFGPPVARD